MMKNLRAMMNDFLIFWGIRKPPEPHILNIYRQEWQRLLEEVSLRRLEERLARSRLEAACDRIDLIEALIDAYPAQQERLNNTFTKASQRAQD